MKQIHDLQMKDTGKLNKVLFILWLLTLPFGSKLFSVSLGFMTLYPNLIIGGAFVLLTLKNIRNWNKNMKYVSFFMFLWFLFALVYVFLTDRTEMGMFHIRILAMQLLFSILVFNAYTEFGWEKCKKYLIIGLKIYLNLLIIVGCFEVFSGIHELGTQTDKFLDLEVSKIFYGPMGFLGNQNDFICYLLFLILMLIVLDDEFRKLKYKLLFYSSCTLFFAFVSESTFGIIASFGIVGVVIIDRLLFTKMSWSRCAMYSVTTLFFMITLMNTPIFYGPKVSSYSEFAGNREVLVKDSLGNYAVKPIKKTLSKVELEKVIYQMQHGGLEDSGPGSTTIRKNLIFIGIDFIKEKPLFGIGPGNFFNRLNTPNSYLPTGTVRSPHNFVIEITSQYGLFGWSYLIILLLLFIGFIRKWSEKRKREIIYILSVFILITILWMMPSSYLYLDINWLFLPIMLCVYLSFEMNNIESEENLNHENN